jgi:hypothetical protein
LDGLSEEDKAYLDGHRNAFERQKKAHEAAQGSDAERKRAAEDHIRATREAAGLPPDAPMPTPKVVAAVLATPTGRISLMVARPETKPNDIPPTTEKFAPDWNAMKEMIAKYDGTWVISRHEFPVSVADILGFFGKDGWEKPADSEKETFEAIVKSGRVFRTDPA